MSQDKIKCGNATHSHNDGKDHTSADCGVEGHFNCDGKDHTPADCGI